MSEILKHIADRLYEGNAKAVAGMGHVGADFRNGVLFVPEVLIAARAMHAGMAILRPLPAQSDVLPAGKVIIGTVQGDLHDIGDDGGRGYA